MEQEYKCKYCGKLCKNSNSLRNHERLCKLNPNHQNNPMLNKKPWNKGLSKDNNEILHKMSINSSLKNEFKPYYCKQCGKLVSHPFGSNKYCSKSCANKHKISNEQKKKISVQLIKFWDNKGRKETNIKIPKSILDLSKRTITKILRRANQGCMICGWNEATCDIHHIQPKKNGGTDDNSNLIVVCPNCHRKIHDHKLTVPNDVNIEVLFKNWTDYYFVDLDELKRLIELNQNIGDIS